ncbi:MAG: glycosyltransferase family 1 protein [bacterium]|nr:glycosyltransferase family 1 protein [bacterium]
MIIGIDASRAIRKEKTGVEWYARNIIENLVKIDSQNQYLLYCDDKPDNWLKGLGDKKNVKIKQLHWGLPYLWTQGRLSLGMILNQPDVLFIPASAMPVLHPKNTVITIHDVAFKKFPNSYSSRQLAYLKWSTQFAAKSAQRVITISEFSRQEIMKYYNLPAEKITVTHLSCDQDMYRVISDRAEINKTLEAYNIDRPYLLFVGRLEKKKNIVNLIKAFSILKKEYQISQKLILIGNKGYGWPEAKKIIEENSLQKDIIMPGYVQQASLPFLYNAADVFVFPSNYEGFGIPILEAFACGTPVVASDSASMPEVAGEAASMVNPEKVEEIALAINKVLTSDSFRKELSEKGLAQAQKFNWEKCARETLRAIMG